MAGSLLDEFSGVAMHKPEVMGFISASTRRRAVVSHRVQFGPR